MRPAHLRAAAALALGALTLPAAAQSPAPASAADAPTAPLRHTPLPESGSVIAEVDDWRAANAAVAAFPRGHASIVRWEAAQQPIPPAAPAARHDHHDHHHGHQP